MEKQHFDFSGKTVLIVGGTSGIGRAGAALFARAGANVVIAGPDPEEGRVAEAKLVRDTRGEVLFIKADVTSETEMQALVDNTVARFGRIHVAVNNAGIEGKFGPVHELESQDFDRIIAVNLKGIWLGMKYQIRHMLEHGGGAIVNTSSSAGVAAIPMVAVYTASKHGVVGMTKSAALELARSNIRVNAIAPGPVKTDLLDRMVAGKIPLSDIAAQVPMGRISDPEEIAEAMLWLASDAASFVTGHTLVLDGGMTVG